MSVFRDIFLHLIGVLKKWRLTKGPKCYDNSLDTADIAENFHSFLITFLHRLLGGFQAAIAPSAPDRLHTLVVGNVDTGYVAAE